MAGKKGLISNLKALIEKKQDCRNVIKTGEYKEKYELYDLVIDEETAAVIAAAIHFSSENHNGNFKIKSIVRVNDIWSTTARYDGVSGRM